MTIYHLAPTERWDSWPANTPYLPTEYPSDGFIHCTAGEELMLAVANRYYRNISSLFVLLTIDETKLDAPLRWEASGDDLAAQFPHVYGPINLAAIVAVRAAQRATDGTFIGWG